MKKHIGKIQELIYRLKALGNEGITEFAPWIILYSMPPSYHILISVLVAKREEKLTIDNIKANLIGEYKRRKMTSPESMYEKALKVNSKLTLKCYCCQGTGHLKRDCPDYLRWKRKNRKRRQERARAVHGVEEQETLSDSDSVSVECILPQQAFSVSPEKQKQKFKQEWYLDSAATSHMTNDITLFDEIDTTYTSKVRVANSDSCSVYGIGKGKIECLTKEGKASVLKLDKVLYIPKFESGLISIGSLDKQGYQVKIKNNL